MYKKFEFLNFLNSLMWYTGCITGHHSLTDVIKDFPFNIISIIGSILPGGCHRGRFGGEQVILWLVRKQTVTGAGRAGFASPFNRFHRFVEGAVGGVRGFQAS